MEFKPKKEWIDPDIQSFGELQGDARPSNQRPHAGPHCGQSVIRYGPQCGVRVGPPCTPRIGQQCLPRIGQQCLPRVGPSCMSRVGHPCVVRIGSQCTAMPDEPLPPGR